MPQQAAAAANPQSAGPRHGPKIRVLIADDHAVVAQGIRELLRDKFDFVGIVHNGQALLEAVDEFHPDVVIVDLSMPVMNGLDAIRRLREKDPHVRAVVLTMHDGRDTAVSAFRAGALGYVLKTSSEEEFSAAIAEVSEGRPWISPLVTDDPVSIIAEACRPGGEPGERLTPRQREVLDLIAEGRTMKEIAAILNMSPRTAESHKYGIMQALGVNTTAALVRYATKDRMIKG